MKTQKIKKFDASAVTKVSGILAVLSILIAISLIFVYFESNVQDTVNNDLLDNNVNIDDIVDDADNVDDTDDTDDVVDDTDVVDDDDKPEYDNTGGSSDNTGGSSDDNTDDDVPPDDVPPDDVPPDVSPPPKPCPNTPKYINSDCKMKKPKFQPNLDLPDGSILEDDNTRCSSDDEPEYELPEPDGEYEAEGPINHDGTLIPPEPIDCGEAEPVEGHRSDGANISGSIIYDGEQVGRIHLRVIDQATGEIVLHRIYQTDTIEYNVYVENGIYNVEAYKDVNRDGEPNGLDPKGRSINKYWSETPTTIGIAGRPIKNRDITLYCVDGEYEAEGPINHDGTLIPPEPIDCGEAEPVEGH